MRGATELLSQYAMYHRDRRNIASHFVGVPMIVFAVGVLLAKPAFMLAGWALTPAWLVFAAVAVWYLTRGNLQLGLAVSAAVGVLIALAHRVGDSGTGAWLAWGIGRPDVRHRRGVILARLGQGAALGDREARRPDDDARPRPDRVVRGSRPAGVAPARRRSARIRCSR